MVNALVAFGASLATHQVSAADFAAPGNVYQLGLPPNRIDVLTSIDGVDFGEAAMGRLLVQVGNRVIPVLGRDALIKNKRVTDRPQDRVDVAALERTRP